MNRVRLKNATGLKLCETNRGSSTTASANDLGVPYMVITFYFTSF